MVRHFKSTNRWKIFVFCCLCASLMTIANLHFMETDVYKTAIIPQYSDMNRWEKGFYDLFDAPNPLASRLGPHNRTFPNKYVIYRCDTGSMSHCGGWGDRVRGIMTAYIVANLTGRVFKAQIIMHDCDIRKFVNPNRVNWILPVSFHKHVVDANDSKVRILDMWGSPKFYGKFSKIDWWRHPGMDSDFLYMKSNNDNVDNFKQSKIPADALKWMNGSNRATINRFLFTHLFRPTDQMRAKITSFLQQNVNPSEKLLCAHLRMGKNPTIPQDFMKGVRFKNLPDVWKTLDELMTRYDGKAKVFIMSDSAKAIEMAKSQKFGKRMFITPGQIIHVEMSANITNGERCDGVEKIIFEELVLVHCDALITTNSGISRMAAYLRGSDKDLYCLTLYGRLVRCSMEQIKNSIYHTRN